MKDFDTWFYVIAFVFYIVAQILRGYKKAKNAAPKPKKAPQQRPGHPVQEHVPVPAAARQKPQTKKHKKRFSFDDLLREFEETLQEKQVQEVEPPKDIAAENEFKGYSETGSEETTREDRAKTLRPVEETRNRLNVEEDEIDPLKFFRDEDYKMQVKVENPYAKILKEHDGLKKAVVLSEILNPKYF